jgi:hypothetical protein
MACAMVVIHQELKQNVWDECCAVLPVNSKLKYFTYIPLRAARRFEYRIPQAPSAAPATQVQITFASAPVITKTIPAITHAAVPKEIRVTTDFISELLFKSTKEAYS